MTAAATSLMEPTAHLDQLRARFRPLFERIAWGNLERERSRIFPHEQVAGSMTPGWAPCELPRITADLAPR
jgi:hypothetical protein